MVCVFVCLRRLPAFRPFRPRQLDCSVKVFNYPLQCLLNSRWWHINVASVTVAVTEDEPVIAMVDAVGSASLQFVSVARYFYKVHSVSSFVALYLQVFGLDVCCACHGVMCVCVLVGRSGVEPPLQQLHRCCTSRTASLRLPILLISWRLCLRRSTCQLCFGRSDAMV